MKKQTFILNFILFAILFSFSNGYSQEKRMVLKKRKAENGIVTYDTIWKVAVIEKNLDPNSGEFRNDTIWKTEKAKSNSNLTIDNYCPQTSKGTILLCGQFRTSSESQNLAFSGLRIGYFVDKDFAVGFNGNITNFEETNYFISGFLRPYFGNSKKGKFFLDAKISLDNENDDTFGYGLGGGYSFFSNKNLSFDASLGYEKYGEEQGGMVIGFGLQVFIN